MRLSCPRCCSSPVVSMAGSGGATMAMSSMAGFRLTSCWSPLPSRSAPTRFGFIPWPLQTAAYAEAVIRCHYTDPDEIRQRVRVRMHRQQLMLDERPPSFGRAARLWALVDEAALAEGFAGTRIMRQQIDFLRQTTEQRNAVIQVLPSSVGGSLGVGSQHRRRVGRAPRPRGRARSDDKG
jgi:hypothetical protein